MRIYFDLDLGSPVLRDLCQLACQNPDTLDLCHVGDLPGTPHQDAREVFPMNWRFFPMLDLQAGEGADVC